MQARVNDISIHYEIEGPVDAPVITFSHSLAAALQLWDLQLPALRDSYRILCFDTRGHGTSSAPAEAYTMEMLSKDVIGLLDHLDIQRTHFVGISMGGMIGQVLAIDHPQRLESLVLCDTTSRVPPGMAPSWEERIRAAETQGMRALAESTLERWLSAKFQRTHPQITERVRNMILNTPVPGYVGCCRAISNFDISAALTKVTTPTLIIVGEEDSSTPVSAAEVIKKQIKGAELLTMPKALHLTNIETAELFNQTLLRFLA